MNTNTCTFELAPAAGAITETKLPATARRWSRRAKWLLLASGLGLTLLVVKAAVLVGQIFAIVNAIYDSSLT